MHSWALAASEPHTAPRGTKSLPPSQIGDEQGEPWWLAIQHKKNKKSKNIKAKIFFFKLYNLH